MLTVRKMSIMGMMLVCTPGWVEDSDNYTLRRSAHQRLLRPTNHPDEAYTEVYVISTLSDFLAFATQH